MSSGYNPAMDLLNYPSPSPSGNAASPMMPGVSPFGYGSGIVSGYSLTLSQAATNGQFVVPNGGAVQGFQVTNGTLSLVPGAPAAAAPASPVTINRGN